MQPNYSPERKVTSSPSSRPPPRKASSLPQQKPYLQIEATFLDCRRMSDGKAFYRKMCDLQEVKNEAITATDGPHS